jgi:hypothetical protein
MTTGLVYTVLSRNTLCVELISWAGERGKKECMRCWQFVSVGKFAVHKCDRRECGGFVLTVPQKFGRVFAGNGRWELGNRHLYALVCAIFFRPSRSFRVCILFRSFNNTLLASLELVGCLAGWSLGWWGVIASNALFFRDVWQFECRPIRPLWFNRSLVTSVL